MGGQWVCAEDNDTVVENTDTLADLNCTQDQIARFNQSAGAWECSDESSGGGLIIEDAGVFVAFVGLGLGANFSLLPGAGGETGVAAADAACAADFPGSHAELDILKLWKAGRDGILPTLGSRLEYWASTQTPIPVASAENGGDPLIVTSDCQGWTFDATAEPRAGAIGVFTLPEGIQVEIGTSVCNSTTRAVACFTD